VPGGRTLLVRTKFGPVAINEGTDIMFVVEVLAMWVALVVKKADSLVDDAEPR
jgi:hypothetical protein